MDIKYDISKFKNSKIEDAKDSVSIEEPLEMKLKYKIDDDDFYLRIKMAGAKYTQLFETSVYHMPSKSVRKREDNEIDINPQYNKSLRNFIMITNRNIRNLGINYINDHWFVFQTIKSWYNLGGVFTINDEYLCLGMLEDKSNC